MSLVSMLQVNNSEIQSSGSDLNLKSIFERTFESQCVPVKRETMKAHKKQKIQCRPFQKLIRSLYDSSFRPKKAQNIFHFIKIPANRFAGNPVKIGKCLLSKVNLQIRIRPG